jgi:hypothetical protein
MDVQSERNVRYVPVAKEGAYTIVNITPTPRTPPEDKKGNGDFVGAFGAAYKLRG